MKKNDKELIAIAKRLGYKEPFLPRESLKEAVDFLNKQTAPLDQITKDKIHCAMQVIINTMALRIAEQVIKEEE